jgi:protein-S-isoprenylcysteine O-methyltransferase Ste14
VLHIAIGVVGFALLFLYDVAAIRQHPRLCYILAAAGGLAIASALVLVCALPPRLPRPPVLIAIGVPMAVVFLLLGCYSILIEIRLHARSRGRKNGRFLMTAGTYALVRHPGVLWYSLALMGLCLAFPSYELLLATPVWIAMDILLAAFEERFYLQVVFSRRYRRYQRSVPFLIPTLKSIRACVRGFFHSLS